MPTSKPRMSVTLSPRLHAVLEEMSRLTSNSQSSIVGELLEQSRPTFERMVRVLRAAELARSSVSEVVAGQVSAAQLQIERLLNLEGQLDEEQLGQLDLLERVERVESRGTSTAARAGARGRGSASNAASDPPSLTGGSGTPKKRGKKSRSTEGKGGRYASI